MVKNKKAILLIVLLLLYTGIGFFAVPAIVKPRLISALTDFLHREVAVETVRFNPFALSATVKNLEITDPDGKKLLSFEELYLNFQTSSIFRRAITFETIHLTKPVAGLSIHPDGQLNIADLFPTKETKPPSTEPPKSPPPVLISDFQIDGGEFVFTDYTQTEPFVADYAPINLQLSGFSTRKDESGRYFLQLTGQNKARLAWSGDLSIQPLRSEGEFKIEGVPLRKYWLYFKDRLNFEIKEGTIGLGGQYQVDNSGKPLQLSISGGSFNLDNFVLTDKRDDSQPITIPRFAVTETELDLASKKVVIGLVNSQDVAVEGWLGPDGNLNFQHLFDLSAIQSETAPEEEKPAAPSEPAWEVTVKKVKLDDYAFGFEDRQEEDVARVDLGSIGLVLNNLSTKPGSESQIALSLAINQSGSFSTQGNFGIRPAFAACDIKLDQLALTPFQPFLNRHANFRIADGAASMDGRIDFQPPEKDGPTMRYHGSFSIGNLNAAHVAPTEEFVTWKALVFNGITFETAPDKINIDEIRFDQPQARIMLWPDKSVNLAGLAKKKKTDVPEEAKPEAQKTPPPITVGAIHLEDALVSFTDYTHEPAFAIGIHNLNGTVSGLSSESWSRANLALEGKIGKYAPVKITGQINPLSSDIYSDVSLLFQNIELTSFTPYAGKYVGQTIEKGKLSLDLQYKLSENVLIGENKVFMDQFTFGQAVESPDATSLPVNLAVGLLKDKNGKIDIDLPVRGNIKDPDFSYGGLILSALTNLIQKAATSPFSALANVTGMDGETLSYVAFPFGTAQLSAAETAKLDVIASALIERPALRLEIAGTADVDADRRALAEREFLARLQPNQAISMDELIADRETYNKLIVQAYYKTFGKYPTSSLIQGKDLKGVRKATIDKEEIVAAASEKLLKNIVIADSALASLAKERAERIKTYLIENGNIPHERLFMVDTQIGKVSQEKSAHTHLTLNAS